ncbi:phosphatase PAP2 family protein [Agromyces sp. ZXT2-6]|uniref:phosphatase PAP2 family protein n=1 Tax=Agromyces sp. ZXT2-6 TaxID=3461153 RepID=UPI004054B432
MTAPAGTDEHTDDAQHAAAGEPHGAHGPRAQAATRVDGKAAARADDLRPEAREERTEYVGRFVPFAVGIASLIIAALLGVILMLRADGMFEIDEEWAEDVFELRGGIGDIFAFGMDALGGGIVGVFLVPIAVAVILLVVRRPWAALFFVVASAASAGVVQLLKNLFGRARPEDMLVASDFGSFPSGHVANAATIAVTIGIIVPKLWVWIAGAIYTALMAVSRTYLGVHWITDTIGGVLIGAGVALLVWVLFARRLERERLDRAAKIAEHNRLRAEAHVTPPARPRSRETVSAG